jgi:hypothetical protein
VLGTLDDGLGEGLCDGLFAEPSVAVVLLEEPQADRASAARAVSPASDARLAQRCVAMR